MSYNPGDHHLFDSDLSGEEFSLDDILAEYGSEKENTKPDTDKNTAGSVNTAGGIQDTQVFDLGELFEERRAAEKRESAEKERKRIEAEAETLVRKEREALERARLEEEQRKQAEIERARREDELEALRIEEERRQKEAEARRCAEEERLRIEREEEEIRRLELERQEAIRKAEEERKAAELKKLKDAGLTDDDILFFDSFGKTGDEPVITIDIPLEEPVMEDSPKESEPSKKKKAKDREEKTISSSQFCVSVNINEEDEEKPKTKKFFNDEKSEEINAYEAFDNEEEYDDYYEEEEKKEGFFSRFKKSRVKKTVLNEDSLEYEEELEEEIEEEPDYLEEYKKYASSVNKISGKSAFAFIVCILMALIAVLYDSGVKLPFGMGANPLIITGILLIMQLFVMILGADIIVSGITDVLDGCISADTLISLSNIVSVVSGFIILLTKDTDHGIYFGTISAFSVMFSLRGKKSYRTAIADTLKSVLSSSGKNAVISDDETVEGAKVLRRLPEYSEGFFTNLMERDITESVTDKMAPMLIIASVVFAVLSSIVKERAGDFVYCLSALLCISASFSMYSAFARPFKTVTKKLRSIGGIIAGWGGACDIATSDYTLITDETLFPKGTVSIEKIRIIDNMSERIAITYTASLLKESGSGLGTVFDEYVHSRGYHLGFVKEFACYEAGGISGKIDGVEVLVGSAAMMNLKGIRIPDEVTSRLAVYTVIGGELAAVFSINYIPANSVQKALLEMLKTRVQMLFAVRDFNITPRMLRQKFKMDMDGIEYIPVSDSYSLSSDEAPIGAKAAGVVMRDGLGPIAEVITRGKQLKLTVLLTTTLMVIGMILGILLVFFVCGSLGVSELSTTKMLVFMLCWHIVVYILSMFASKG